MREDHWLGERLGCRAWTVEDEDTVEAVAACGPGFYQAKVPADRVDRVGSLEDAGFRTIDVNVTLRRAAGGPVSAEGASVRDARDGDRDAVVTIAERDHTVSRFHLDPRIPDGVARAIKRDWVENYFRGARGDRLLVLERTGQVLGFLAVLDSADAAVIDLITVAASARGRGAGGALVSALVTATPDRPVLTGTQISNVDALRFYERLGFTVLRAQFVLHRHV